ncbi:MAG: uroporphyrinogen-III synthase [Ktedonobacteraceae bacterium]
MQGKRIVVTRAIHQAGALSTLLSQRGAEVLLYPCIAIVPPKHTVQLDNAIQDMTRGAFDWLVLTSANAVLILSQRLEILGVTPAASLALACVGPATAEAAERLLGMQAQVLPEEYVAEALFEVIRPSLPACVLLLQAEGARPVLREELATAGATITALTTYHTVLGEGGVHLSTLLQQRLVDVITFTSASTVQNCVHRLQAERADLSLLADVCLACIGPVTAQALCDLGLVVGIMPAKHTVEGLVEEVDAYFRSSLKGEQLYV